MENRLFLNCSLYTEEKSIPLYSESPLLKAPNVEDDLIIYEDAQYFGRISISENEKLIRKIKILLNDTEIGYVDFQKKSGNIEFKKNSGGVSQPFLLQCDLVELCIKIIYEDDSIEYLYTPYLLCVSKSEDDRENIKNILIELLQFDNDKINKLMFYGNNEINKQDGLIEGSVRPESYKSISTYLYLLEQIINCYKSCFAYFKSSPKHSIDKVYEMKNFLESRYFSHKDLVWLSHNMEQLSQCNTPTAIKYNGNYYMPLKVLSERKKFNYDIYENKVIISFLKSIMLDTDKLKKEFEKTVIEEDSIYKKLKKFSIDNYYAPIITVKEIQNQQIKKVLKQIEKIITELKRLLTLYSKCLPCTLFRLEKVPRKTKIFQEIKPYKIMYDMIVKWFEFGEVDLKKDKAIFRVKTMDKLFEYYSLQQILKMLIIDEGFNDKSQRLKNVFYEYSIDDGKYKNEKDVANTYLFERGKLIAKLYYQPVVLSDGYQNDLELYKITDNGRNYYTPDFILKILNQNKNYYFIFDSKFYNRKNIKNHYLRECIMKYGMEIEAAGYNNEINMVCLLQGRIDREETPLLYQYNNSPNARRNNVKKFYGIISINSKANENSRKILWKKIIANIK